MLAAPLIFAAQSEYPAAVTTRGGSRLVGMLKARPLMLKLSGGGGKQLDLEALKTITFGERPDPNLENQAALAAADLKSDQFKLRDEAMSRLRSLGHAAVRALQNALKSPDVEVASKARTLLSEMNIKNAADTFLDRVSLSDGSSLVGELKAAEFVFRSRWGVLKLPVETLDSLDFLPAGDVRSDLLAAAGQAPLSIEPYAQEWVQNLAERWDPLAEMPQDGPIRGMNPQGMAVALQGRRVITFDEVPADAKGRKLAPANPGQDIGSAYAPWGIFLKAVESNEKVETVLGLQLGVSGKLAATSKNADCDIQFIIPGSFDAQTGEARDGGVCNVGAFVKASGAQTIGLAVYDRSGRQLAQVFNQVPSGVNRALPSFLGVHSKVPIVRARIFRAGAARNEDLVFDDLVFDHVVSVERGTHLACVWLSSGDRLAGKLTEGTLEAGLKLKPEFISEKLPETILAVKEIERYEPARAAEDQKPEKLRFMGLPQAVLLQSGEHFHARLMSLDASSALFMLPGGVELKLPREMLRKIEIRRTNSEKLFDPPAVAADEKPGVDFMQKDEQKAQGAKADVPKNPKDPRNNENNPAQGLPRIDDAEIISIDVKARELTVRDDAGDFTIGLDVVKSLVFPENPKIKKGAKFREWQLTLREGSSFEIALKAITPDGITAEMAGGTITLPSRVVDAVERVKR